MFQHLKRHWGKWLAATSLVGALGIAKWYDPAILYHTFPPTPAADHRITENKNNRQITFTHQDLEHRLGVQIKGEYSDEAAVFLKDALEPLKREEPQLFSNIKTIILIPPEDYDLFYSGVAMGDTIALNGVTGATAIHELAHTRSFELPDTFWKEWTAVSKGHYRHETVPALHYLEMRLEHGRKADPAEAFVPYKPRFGFVSEYGEGNPDEDLAEFVEAIHTNSGILSQTSAKEMELYAQKIHLLHKWGFINTQKAQDASETLLLNSEEGVARLIMRYADDIPDMHPIRLNPYGMTLYESKDGKLSITYGACRDLPHLSMTLFPQNGNSKGYRIAIENPIGLPQEIHDLLKSKGYLDANAYNIERVYFAKTDSREDVAKREGVSPDMLKGPLPMYNPYADSEQHVYYIQRPAPTMMTVISDTP